MLGRAVRGCLSKISAALLGAALIAPAACSVSFSTSSMNGNAADNSDAGTYDAGTTDDRMTTGGADSGAGAPDGAGAAFEGSPLCNYSKPHGCLPDVPPTMSDCNVSDAGADSSDAGAAAPLACRVGFDTTLAAPAPACVRAGYGHDGDACQTGADCAAGFECVGAGECRHYCCEESTCDAFAKDTFCDVQAMKAPPVAGANVPACMPVRSCKLLMPGYCADGETCAVVRPSDGTTSCVAIGPAKVGDNCDETHCGDGLVCLGTVGSRSCFQLCRTSVSSDCPSGQTCKSGAPLFQDPSVGICK